MLSSNGLWSGIVRVLVALGGLALITVGILVFRKSLFADRAQEFWFRQHWGGFGGGSTGWDASRDLLTLLAGSVLVLLGALTLIMALGSGGGS